LDQEKMTAKNLTETIKTVLEDKTLQENYRNNIGKIMKQGASKSFLEIIEKILF
jgi:UDP-N-acetylglucosamine:LPS N-acetylglucosamine transferase